MKKHSDIGTKILGNCAASIVVQRVVNISILISRSLVLFYTYPVRYPIERVKKNLI